MLYQSLIKIHSPPPTLDLDAETNHEGWSERGAAHPFASAKQSLDKAEVILVSTPEVLGETGKRQCCVCRCQMPAGLGGC